MLHLLIIAIVLLPPAFFLEEAGERFVDRHPEQRPLWNYLYQPGLRALFVVALVFGSYPAVFGLADAPPLGETLGQVENGFDKAFHLVLLLGFLLPAIPVIGRIPGLTIPLQAWGLLALLAEWTALAMGVDSPSLWPGVGTATSMLVLALLGHFGPRLMPARVRQRPGLAAFSALALQIPAIYAYGLALGRHFVGT